MSVAALRDEGLQPQKKRHLRSVPGVGRKHSRHNPVFLTLVTVAAIMGIFSAQLWLNLAVSKGAYEISSLEVQTRDLSREERTVKLELEKLSSPQNLAERAIDLKMVQNTHPALLDLASKTVIGTAGTATATPKNNLVENSALSDLRLADQAVVSQSDTSVESVYPSQPASNAEKENLHKPEVAKQNTSDKAIAWEGKLVAPATR